jgi:hypothetical protein
MRHVPGRRLVTAAVATTLLTAGSAMPTPASPMEPGRRVATIADWRMNEHSNARVMHDSSGHHLNGIIAENAHVVGLTSHSAYYRWSPRCSNCLPVQDHRIVRVPDDDRLDITNPRRRYTLTFRFQTHHAAGNYIEKGHSTVQGGQIKVQGPGGLVQCLFKGANGSRVGTGSGRRLNDGRWHVVRCVHTAGRVTEYVDGKRTGVKNGSTGPINNASPFIIGGKLRCNQTKVTCDYYSGRISWVRVTRG